MSAINFIWAQAQDANVREPIKELTEKGWQHRDIPKASNMNWIFNQISNNLFALRKEIQQHAIELKNKLDDHTSRLQEQEAVLASLKNELEVLSENHIKFKNCTNQQLSRSLRANDFNTGIARQICLQLKVLEQNIRHYHVDFPEFNWPLPEGILTVVYEEENEPNNLT
jgi:hypothetical protein